MNPEEIVMLARYVRALCPQQKFDEYTPDAWHDILSPYTLDEARAAVGRHIAAGNAFVAVGEIVTQIRTARNARAADIQGPGQPAEIPDADPDDLPAYLEAVRGQRHRAISGDELRPRLVPALTTNVGQLPRTRQRPGPLTVACPHCEVEPGMRCVRPSGKPLTLIHPARMRAASGAA